MPKIRIIGIGGGGNAIVSEVALRVKKASFVMLDADVGEKRAKNLFEGIDFCILVSCLGGQVGSNILPILAEASRRSKIITLGIFVLPFEFEGEERIELAKVSLANIKPNLSASVVVSNQKLLNVTDNITPFKEAFSIVNQWVAESLEGLIKMFDSSGLISTNFADLKMTLTGRGKLAFLNSVEAEISQSIQGTARKVVFNRLSPYLAYKAKKILFNITGGENLSINEINQIGSIISKSINPQAKISFGITQDKQYQNRIRITLLATGCQWQEQQEQQEK